uniref:DUF4167 domain-containing protein n=1 Tax=Altererythrobacter segetis TaxID=1104773 RepID=UPI00140E12F3|nr:DUF4167 domain-containing protein [Altererythrobacter segetis]
MTRPEGIRTVTQARKRIPLNNNNRNNNRRRGRSNRGPGGGNQGNRIDSRARGNAPQMLEKYKKMAHDASLNGDRVQTEYYLQFADHYFRVIADTRSQNEPRPRRDDRDQDDSSDGENEFEDNTNRSGRDSRDFRDADDSAEGHRRNEGEEVSQDDEENPFVAESRPRRNNRPRNGRAGNANGAAERDEEPSAGLDPASLPPAIGTESDAGEEEARPRRRARRPRDAGDDEALEAVG